MDQRDAESGTEFVLDNRKLIIGFIILMCVCGAFFAVGFMEGKRQAIQTNLASVPDKPAEEAAAEADTQRTAVIIEKDKPAEEPSVREQLDWYKSVNQPADQAARSTIKTQKEPSVPPEERPQPDRRTEAVYYTVQVGAFSRQPDAQKKMAELRSKGYTCFLDSPGTDNKLFLVKVGKFESRADAVAMQLRLKKDGFSTFIKGN